MGFSIPKHSAVEVWLSNVYFQNGLLHMLGIKVPQDEFVHYNFIYDNKTRWKGLKLNFKS